MKTIAHDLRGCFGHHLPLATLVALALLAAPACRYNPKFESGVVPCDPAPAPKSCPAEVSFCVAQEGGSGLCCSTATCAELDGGRTDGRLDDARDATTGDTTSPPSDGGDVGGDSGAQVDGGGAEAMPLSCSSKPCTGQTADGCCPANCSAATDVDCTGCGNGKVEANLGETCEGTACPTTCAPVLCAKVALTGTAETCTATCAATPITTCSLISDNCCPVNAGGAATCSAADDIDCRAVCGNVKVEPGETCDPVTDCTTKKTACVDDANKIRKQSGDATKCTFACAETDRNCVDGDGFCPTRCGPSTDADCPGCGNGKIEAGMGETCDPLSMCQTKKGACVSDANTIRTASGDATKCTFVCVEASRACGAGDGFCPSGCGPTTDADCPGCGNAKVEANLGETCEGAGCPATCTAAQCMKVTRTGSAQTCDVKCTSVAITACSQTSDNCCPVNAGGTPLCSANQDIDCGAVCGNGTVEPGETCESDCAAKKNACVSDANKVRSQSGDATKCTFTCVESNRNCLGGDGFCPSQCGPTNDTDCNGCGNGRTETNLSETCDPLSQCQQRQAACVSDGNTIRTSAGNPATCTYVCNQQARACSSTGDGYCPSTCAPTNDYDCPGCGNNRTEGGETCDGNCQPIISGCTSDANYVRTVSGAAGSCNVACNTAARSCGPSDGQCPSGCSYPTDPDCPECTNGDTQACPNDPSNVITCSGGRWPSRPTPCPGACPTTINDAWSASKPLGYGTAPWRIIWPPEASSAAKPTNLVAGRVDFPWDSVIYRDALPGGYVVTFMVAIDPVTDFAVQPSFGTGPFPAIRRVGSGLRVGGLAYGNANSFTSYGSWTDQVVDFGQATVTLYVKAGAKQLAAYETSGSTDRGSGFVSPVGFDPTTFAIAGSNSLVYNDGNRALLHGMVGNIKGCAGLTDGQVDAYYQQKKTYP